MISLKKLFLLTLLPYICFSCMKTPISPDEKAILVTANDFVDYGLTITNIAASESFSKETYLDGGKELNYVFEPKDSENDLKYLSNIISIEPSSKDALATFKAQWIGLGIGMTINKGKISTPDLNHIYRFGDRSEFKLINNEEGEPVGNIFIVQKGSMVFFISIVGLYFDEAEDWADFIEPKLEKAIQYQNSLLQRN